MGIPAFARASGLHPEPPSAAARVARSQARASVLEGVEMKARILLPVVGLVFAFSSPASALTQVTQDACLAGAGSLLG